MRVRDLASPRQWRRTKILVSVGMLLAAFSIPLIHDRVRTPGAALTSHNYTERPIGSYWVNDQWGGNGGVTCCWSISGESAKVVWILSMSQAQENQGMKIERHETQVALPERSPGDDTLHVYFLPNNRIELVWAAKMLDTLPLRTEALMR
ncbi:DUF3304 domain-containing protein [Pseudomonas sp. Y5-11]|uniref:DUF3304 domain-containing protein n=2 Tax=unclassified Pseudomonas TaxID=196821 RepID=UPI0015F99E16|nr:DUF3304 domain-containing protein [Pseudomonas sp. MD195_PC81_125]ULN83723.1 DUF3304 domain-containing protein [Pseudomonas sp. Y5-11]